MSKADATISADVLARLDALEELTTSLALLRNPLLAPVLVEMDARLRAVEARQERQDAHLARLDEALRELTVSLSANTLDNLELVPVLDALDATPAAETGPGTFPLHSPAWDSFDTPAPTPTPAAMPEAVRQLIGEAVGEASMCWLDHPPRGTFDSTRAAAIVDRVCAALPPALPADAAETLREAADSLENSAASCANRGLMSAAQQERYTAKKLRAMAEAVGGGK